MAIPPIPSHDRAPPNDPTRFADGLCCAPGTPFLRWLVRHLARELECDWVIAWERVGPAWESIRIAAASQHGEPFDQPLELEMAGSPCERVYVHGHCVWPSDVQAAFPDLAILKQLAVESYVGLRLVDSVGRALGHLTILHGAPCPDPEAWLAKLRQFEVRVAGELASRRAVQELEELVAASDGRGGRDTLVELTRALAHALQVRAGFVCELLTDRPHHVRASAIVVDGASIAGGEADLSGTPCGVVYRQPLFLVEDGLADRFPHWPLLALLPARSYLGIEARSHDGKLLGHMSVLHDRPLPPGIAALPILRLYADRAAAEIERRRAAAQQLAAERKLAEARKAESLGLLAAGLAHDLNNRLTSVLGHVSLLREDAAPATREETGRHLEAIEAATRAAADVVQQMLACGGHCIVDAAPHDVSQLAAAALEPLLAELPEGVQVERDLATDLPSIAADGARLRQAIEVLLRNAKDALPAGRGRLRLATGRIAIDARAREALRFTAELEDGEHLFIEVADDGRGLDEATLARVFEPFFTTRSDGQGLGLAVADGVARGHRGALMARSSPGRGSSFRIVLPLAPPRGVASPSEAPPASHSAAPLRGLALLVDDEPMVRAATARMLERLGIAVQSAGGGEEALALLERYGDRIDFALLDLTMPRMSGEELFRRMRAARPELPVVLMTGFSAPDAFERFQDAGLAGFLQKPFGLLELERCLKRSLRPAGGAAARTAAH